MKRVLTGIKPTGVPHIGNYLGAIRPSIELTRSPDTEAYLFIADLHSLTTRPEPTELQEQVYSVAAAWLAFGLDPEVTVFYRQRDVPEIPQIAWALGCSLPVGFLNRAHSFKDAKARGTRPEDVLFGVYSYPVLMAADILAFDTDLVPVGKDQKQHLEIAQEAARKFNLRYGEVFKVPEARIDPEVMTVPGLDGQKMSKSYGNTLDAFMSDRELMKRIKTIKTDSTEYGAPLPADGDAILALYSTLADPAQVDVLRAQYRAGRKDPSRSDDAFENPSTNYFGWGDAKKALRDLIIDRFAEEKRTYDGLMADRGTLDAILERGAERARAAASVVLDRVFRASGLSPR